MEDRLLTCVQCESKFILTANERQKLTDRGFDLPKRCPECRRKKYRDFKGDNEEWGPKRKKRHPRREKLYFEENDDI